MLNKEDIWRQKGNYHEEDLVSTEGKMHLFPQWYFNMHSYFMCRESLPHEIRINKKKLSLIMFVHVGKAWGRRWKKSKDDLKTCEIQDLRNLSQYPLPPPAGKVGLSKMAQVPEGEHFQNC